MTYEWRAGHPVMPGVDAQRAGERIEALRKRNGGNITPHLVVDDARSSRSALHKWFEWDDEAAAEAYRVAQARKLMGAIVVRIEERPLPMRAFVCVRDSEKEGAKTYTSIHVAMEDEDLRKQLLNNALHELKSWRERYDELKQLAQIFAAVDEQLPLIAKGA